MPLTTKDVPKDIADVINGIMRATSTCCSRDTIDCLYSAILESLGNKTSSKASPSRPKQEERRGKNKKRAKKRYRYARVQDLFKKSPGLLAKHIRMGTDYTEKTLNCYTKVCGAPSPTCGHQLLLRLQRLLIRACFSEPSRRTRYAGGWGK